MMLSKCLIVGLTAGLGMACGDNNDALQNITPAPFPDVKAATAKLPRLTQIQYSHAIVDVFGDSLALPTRLEPDVSIDGLIAVGAAETSVSSRGAEQYETAAYNIAEQVVGSEALRKQLIPCSLDTTNEESCAGEVLASLGHRLWRRPLSPAEVDTLVAISTNASATLGDPYLGLHYGIAALLQSPYFLFRHDVGQNASGLSGRRYTNYEMASRLSFFLWNTIPDLDLLRAAENGDLLDDALLAEQVNRMLADPKAHQSIRNFFSELYNLYSLDQLSKDTNEFRHMNAELGASAREETLRTIEDHIFEQNADFRKLFTTKKTFLNRQLAALYNVKAPSKEGYAAYLWPETSQRGGILTQVSFLAGNSHPIDSSATLRGKFVRQKVMCTVISPPPVDINAALPDPSEDIQTLRERLREHVADPTCAGCHNIMDPIGLTLENFDALGQYRLHDNGAELDLSGEIDGVTFSGPEGLGKTLSNSEDVPRCLVNNLFRYATSHIETKEEKVILRALLKRFEQRGYRILDLMRDIAMSPGFRNLSGESHDE